MKKGAIAAGHPKTVEAARLILEDGGNAFDAAIAAVFASFVVEPCMSSIGGGGFMIAKEAGNTPQLLDFFCQTPANKKAAKQLDFYPITINYGTSSEEFHLGRGSMAVPGIIKGLFEIHRRYASLSLHVLLEPAIQYAKKGVIISDFLAYNYLLLEPMLQTASGGNRLFFEKDGHLKKAGDLQFFPGLADFLENLIKEGPDFFYQGEPAQKITEACVAGGQITLADMKAYKANFSKPLSIRYKNKKLYTNKPPSTGGSIICYALSLLSKLKNVAPDSSEFASQLLSLIQKCQNDRVNGSMNHFIEKLLGASGDLLKDQGNRKWGNTTHLSLMDVKGNAVSITLSNGEGSGFLIPGTDSIMNNMLGEAALMPAGFHSWHLNRRLSSMMSPSILTNEEGEAELVLGTGGASRIPWMILQVLHYYIDVGMDIEAALRAPRMHLEEGILNAELGINLDKNSLVSTKLNFKQWKEPSMFFGGVHSVCKTSKGCIALADERREGAATKL